MHSAEDAASWATEGEWAEDVKKPSAKNPVAANRSSRSRDRSASIRARSAAARTRCRSRSSRSRMRFWACQMCSSASFRCWLDRWDGSLFTVIDVGAAMWRCRCRDALKTELGTLGMFLIPWERLAEAACTPGAENWPRGSTRIALPAGGLFGPSPPPSLLSLFPRSIQAKGSSRARMPSAHRKCRPWKRRCWSRRLCRSVDLDWREDAFCWFWIRRLLKR